MQRFWGRDGEFADANSPTAWWRAWDTHRPGGAPVTVRTVERWYEGGLRLDTEVGSFGWPGFGLEVASHRACVAGVPHVTHVNTITVGLDAAYQAITDAGNQARTATARAGLAASDTRAPFDVCGCPTPTPYKKVC